MLEIRNAKDEYKGYRDLWCKTFGDEPSDIKELFDAFGGEIEAYVMVDDNGKADGEQERKVVSALTVFRMGELVGPSSGAEIPCYVSYAICTDEEAQGKGYGSTITEFARNEVLKKNAVSMLCPANAKLIGFYEPLGYKAIFPAYEGCVDSKVEAHAATSAEAEALAEGSAETEALAGDSVLTELGRLLAIEKITADEYNQAREKMLANDVHVRLGKHALSYIEKISKEFISVDGGKLIAVVDRVGKQKLYLSEALACASCDTAEMETTLAAVGAAYNKKQVVYRTKGDGYLQAMISSENGCDFEKGYFGFPFD